MPEQVPVTREEIDMILNGFPGIMTASPRGVKLTIERLAKALLAEMDKPKLWDGAPDNANRAHVNFFRDKAIFLEMYCPWYTRTLPKSRAREIAEELHDKLYGPKTVDALLEIESAILKREAELGGER